MNIKLIAVMFFIFLIAGCSPYQLTVDDYVIAAPRVNLGMTKEEAIKILQPSQRRLRNTEIKQPDMYKKDNILVEILYFRSGWQSDGLSTDDEYTPYLFNDGKLIAKGWAILGGAKSQGQVVPRTNIHTTTIIY